MKTTLTLENNTELLIRSANTYERNGILYVDVRTNLGRLRFSTNLRATADNKKKLLNNTKDFVRAHLQVKNEAKSLGFNDFLQAILRDATPLKQSTKNRYKSLANQLKSAFGNKDLRLLSNDHFRDFFSKHNNLSKSSLKLYAQMVNRVITLGREADITHLKKIDVRRCESLKLAREMHPFSLEEVREILSACDEPLLRDYLTIAFFTGARTGEILALKVQDIDLANERIHIRATLDTQGNCTAPKTKQSVREIDVLSPLKATLQALVRDRNKEEFLLGGRKSIQIHKLRESFVQLQKKLGLQPRVLYITRHSFASIMLAQGEEPMWVSAMLGHKSLNITLERYVKYLPKKKRRATFLDGFVLEGTADEVNKETQCATML